jgi:myo-inositol 2-dehydrogenase/D-chiro-inositol 1-dehydrogenase
MPAKAVRVGLVGAGFVAEIHAAALARVAGAELVAVASPTPGRRDAFARRFELERSFASHRELLDWGEVDLVILAVPNHLHCEVTVDLARAGKHVVIEKPLCLALDEADRMIAAGKECGVHLFYAEELCFAPKYVRAKALVDAGALGKVHLVKQAELHGGPHAEWFWDVERSGGGVALDMGCHAIEFFRWMLGKPPIKSVYAQMGTHVHGARTRGDDHSIIIVEFEGGAVGMAEESWAKPGGMEDRAEVYGSKGVIYADLLRGSSLLTYSEAGYDYAVEKAGSTTGWSFTMYEELWNYGFPQELQHFVDVLRLGLEPLETAADGRAVLEAIFAAYASAASGRKIELPFTSPARRPIDLWKPAK